MIDFFAFIVGVELGVIDGDAVGVGVNVGVGVGDGEGVALGVTVTIGVGDGVGVPVTIGAGLGRDDPTTRLYPSRYPGRLLKISITTVVLSGTPNSSYVLSSLKLLV